MFNKHVMILKFEARKMDESSQTMMLIDYVESPINTGEEMECETSNGGEFPIIDRGEYMFTVVFTMEAIGLIKRLGECLEAHALFRDFLELMSPVILPELERDFEQKLAMYISLNMKNGKQMPVDTTGNFSQGEIYTVNDDNVTLQVTNLIRIVLNICYETIPPEGTISHMIDGYPIYLLSKVCKTNLLNAHIIGESMRRFINIRKTYKRWLPVDLQMSTISNCDIIGAPNSPLLQHELLSLYRYLGSESCMYVTILLNCLFELGEHEKILASCELNPDNIIKICKSAWLCLFFSTINCPINNPHHMSSNNKHIQLQII